MTGRITLDTVDSTNAEAARRARAGEPGPLWITAREQTAGRGRQGRGWVAPEGNLSASLLIRPAMPPAQAACLSFAAALATADLAAALAPRAHVTLKWPNDVLMEDRKIAGILLESASRAGAVDWVVIGIGVNLIHEPEGTAPGSHAPGAIAALGGRRATPDEALDILDPALSHWTARLQADGFAPLRNAWLGLAARLGAEISVRGQGGPLTGIFEDVDTEGALVLRTPRGARRIAAADVHFPG